MTQLLESDSVKRGERMADPCEGGTGTTDSCVRAAGEGRDAVVSEGGTEEEMD